MIAHVEFLDQYHFTEDYHRVPPMEALKPFISFYWETNFEHIFEQYGGGFSDVLLPDIAYTYTLKLGTPFTFQIGTKKFVMNTDGFLPRPAGLICHHSPGNKIFGIKFKISTVLFEKKVNFSEYQKGIFPLSYLIDKNVVREIKSAKDFLERTEILDSYFEKLLMKFQRSKKIQIVSEALEKFMSGNDQRQVKQIANVYKISPRTLQRYFQETTGLSTKQAKQIATIRSAVKHLVATPATFDFRHYGYYDKSHFLKQLKRFFSIATPFCKNPHLEVLNA